MRKDRLSIVIALAISSSLTFANVATAETRLNSGTTQWAAAAREGRADMLILGDSIVAYGTGGWATGIAQAAQGSIGLAGGGLLAPPYDLPYVWAQSSGTRIWSGPAEDSLADDLSSLTPSGRHYTVPGSFSFVGTGVDPVKLDRTRAMNWHVYAAGTSADAQLQATRTRRTNTPWSADVIQTTPTQQVGADLAEYVFQFGATNDTGDWHTFEFTGQSRDTALYYSKLMYANSTGMNVSGWSYSGGTTQGFRDEYYNNSRFTTDGRDAMYGSLVAGNSGMLNVAITFGVNDAGGQTPAAYAESIRGLIGDVRRDWVHAGFDLADLSFTLVSAYQVNRDVYSPARFEQLGNLRLELDGIAATDSQVSFIDIWEAGPDWQEAVANGYLADRVHPSPAGTTLYGDVLMRQFMPRQGDADIDGDVDFDDLLALAQHYGQTNVAWRDGDFDGLDGVTFADLLSLAQQYGTGSVTPEQFAADWALAQSMVPEPASMIGFTAALVGLRRRRGAI